jgi:hypothetical protein
MPDAPQTAFNANAAIHSLPPSLSAHLGAASLDRPLRQSRPTPAWDGHLPFAFWCIEKLRPRTLVELGTHAGTSYFGFCQAVRRCQTETQCHAVDTWQGDVHAKAYGEEIFRDVDAYNQTHYAEFSHLLRMTFDEALARLEDNSIDLLHIDGFHTYEAVRHDFDTWLPRMSPRGVVLFHDSNVFRNQFGVWRLMRELESRYPHFHFPHSSGLSLFLPGAEPPPEAVWLTRLSRGDRKLWQQAFARLGDGMRQPEVQLKRQGRAHQAWRELRARLRPWRPL